MLFWNIYLSSSRILCWLCQTLAGRAQNTSTLPSLNYRWQLILCWSTCWWMSQVHYPLLCYLQILDHVTMVWDLRWNLNPNQMSKSCSGTKEFSPISTIPTGMQVLHTALLANSIILFQMHAIQILDMRQFAWYFCIDVLRIWRDIDSVRLSS